MCYYITIYTNELLNYGLQGVVLHYYIFLGPRQNMKVLVVSVYLQNKTHTSQRYNKISTMLLATKVRIEVIKR